MICFCQKMAVNCVKYGSCIITVIPSYYLFLVLYFAIKLMWLIRPIHFQMLSVLFFRVILPLWCKTLFINNSWTESAPNETKIIQVRLYFICYVSLCVLLLDSVIPYFWKVSVLLIVCFILSLWSRRSFSSMKGQ